MSQTVHYGFQGKLYVNTGSFGSPTWAEVKNVRGAKVGAAFDSDDNTTRLGGGVGQEEPVILRLGWTGQVRVDEGDTNGYLGFKTAFLTRALVDVMLLSGDKTVSGNHGVRFEAKLHKFERDEDNGKVQYVDVEIKPCISDNPAQSVVVTAGSPVFTSLAA